MALARDVSGIETIPMRLLIVAAVASLSILPAAEALETLKTREFLARAAQQLDSIVVTAEVLSVEGPGSIRTLSLDFSSSSHTQFSRLVLGDERDGPNASSAVLELDSGAHMVRSISGPTVTMMSREGKALEVTNDVVDLRMGTQYEDGILWVLLEVV